jgi:hypothetical protein
MGKRLALALLLVVATRAPAGAGELPPGGTFVDDDGSVHQGTIEAIAALGITRGCNPPANDRYCPEDPVTRGEMAAFLVRALDLPAAATDAFSDGADSIFEDDINRLAAAGITRGCDPPVNDRYCPDDPVTRGQMAAFLARALDLPPTEETVSFADDDTTPFEQNIEQIYAAGITVGCGAERFCPNDATTRAEMASFLARALHLDPVPVPARPITVDVVPREGWGAAPPRGSFTEHEIDHITIHHAWSEGSGSGPAVFRSWQNYHFSLGWPDLAYHFIVGKDGKVYEGRPYTAVGDTATSYDPTGHFLIVVEGYFDEDVPTPQQLEMLARMIAWASVQFDVPADEIAGHRDYAATTCPGANLYAKIVDGSLAERAAEIIAAGGVTLTYDG